MKWKGQLVAFAFVTAILTCGAAALADARRANPPETEAIANSSARMSPSLSIAASSLLCSISEANSRTRCYSSCGQTGVSNYTPGVCGVGSKCTCQASPEQPPIN